MMHVQQGFIQATTSCAFDKRLTHPLRPPPKPDPVQSKRWSCLAENFGMFLGGFLPDGCHSWNAHQSSQSLTPWDKLQLVNPTIISLPSSNSWLLLPWFRKKRNFIKSFFFDEWIWLRPTACALALSRFLFFGKKLFILLFANALVHDGSASIILCHDLVRLFSEFMASVCQVWSRWFSQLRLFQDPRSLRFAYNIPSQDVCSRRLRIKARHPALLWRASRLFQAFFCALLLPVSEGGGIIATTSPAIWLSVFDILVSASILVSVALLSRCCWNLREIPLCLMDQYHSPIPPFKSGQTHRPSWFIARKYGAPRCRRPRLDANFSGTDDELDCFLDEELVWLRSRHQYWHADWSLLDTISSFLFHGQSQKLMLLTCQILALTACWLAVLWIKSLLSVGLSLRPSGYGLDAGASVHWDSEFIFDEFVLLIVMVTGFAAAVFTRLLVHLCLLIRVIRLLPPRLCSLLPGLFPRWWRLANTWLHTRQDSEDSLAQLRSDLDNIMGHVPKAWDWTSLINNPAYSYLDDRPPDMSSPLIPSPSILPAFIRFCNAVWIESGFTRAWFWVSLWCWVLVPPWRLVYFGVLLALATLRRCCAPVCASGCSWSVEVYANSPPLHLTTVFDTAFQPSAFVHDYYGAAFIRLLKGRPQLGFSYFPDSLDPAIRDIFEAWHEATERELHEFIDAVHVDASAFVSASNSIKDTAAVTDRALALTNKFISSFNTATAGLNGLILERLDQLAAHSCISPRRVSVSLGDCMVLMRDFAVSNMCLFPAIMETVLNSIGNMHSHPLVVDTGASCCISPDRTDFIHYTKSKAQV